MELDALKFFRVFLGRIPTGKSTDSINEKEIVSISLPKYLISNRGALEFSKKFFVYSRDLSPVSVKMIRSSRFSVTHMAVLKTVGCRNL